MATARRQGRADRRADDQDAASHNMPEWQWILERHRRATICTTAQAQGQTIRNRLTNWMSFSSVVTPQTVSPFIEKILVSYGTAI